MEKPNLWFHLRVAGIVAILIAGVYVYAATTGVIETYLGSEFAPLFLILGGYILARQFQTTLLRSWVGSKLEKYSEPLQVVYKVLFSVGAIGLVYIGWGVPGVFYASIVADIIVAVIAGFVLGKYLDLNSVFSFKTPLPRNRYSPMRAGRRSSLHA